MSEKILINEIYLSSDYLPSKLMFREKELQQFVNNLKNRINTLIIGPVGSGKTSLVRLGIEQIEEKIEFHYVDCAIYDTQYAVLREILPRTQLMMYKSVYELIKYLSTVVKQNKKKMVVCFDNFNRLKEPEIVKKIINLGVHVVMIGRVERDHMVLTENVITYIPSLLRLRNYSKGECLAILRDRAKKAITPSAHSDKILEIIAEKTHGNIARALGILKFLCLQAEVTEKNSLDEIDHEIFHNPVYLNNDEQMLLRIIENNKKVGSNKLYKEYASYAVIPKGKRCFSKYMWNIAALNMVKAFGRNSGRVYEIV